MISELVAGSAKTLEHTDVYDLEPGHTPQKPRVRRIKSPHKVHEVFWDMCRDPRLLGVLGQLLGPSGVRLYGSKIDLKAPHYGSPVEWHQDWAFYPHTNDDVLAVGVMLDDMLPENGPLMAIPGSHRGPVFDHHNDEGYFCGAMDPDRGEVDMSQAVTLSGPAGSMSFHHVRSVHGSAQNVSDRPRQLLLYEYAAADAFPVLGVKDWEDFNGKLLSGSPQPAAAGRCAGAPAAAALAAAGLDLREPDHRQEILFYPRGVSFATAPVQPRARSIPTMNRSMTKNQNGGNHDGDHSQD